MRQILFNLYLDWVNNYLTIEKFAEHNLIDVDSAKMLIVISEKIFHEGRDFEYKPEAMTF